MEQISPNERKGYFLHHTPLTTTSARSCHVLGRENRAKNRAASRKTTSHSRPASESNMLEYSAVIRLCGQAPPPGYDSWAELVWEALLHTGIKQYLGSGSGG